MDWLSLDPIVLIITIVSSFLCPSARVPGDFLVTCFVASVLCRQDPGDIIRYVYNSSFTYSVACFTSSVASVAMLATVSEAALAKLLALSAAPE